MFTGTGTHSRRSRCALKSILRRKIGLKKSSNRLKMAGSAWHGQIHHESDHKQSRQSTIALLFAEMGDCGVIPVPLKQLAEFERFNAVPAGSAKTALMTRFLNIYSTFSLLFSAVFGIYDRIV